MFFIFHGEDGFSQGERIAEMRSRLGDPSSVELNAATIDGRAALTLGALREACDALPFLAERRLVVVEGLLTRLLGREEDDEQAEPALAKGRGKSGGAARELLEQLAAYLPSMAPTTDLVFLETRKLPDKHALIKLAAAQPHAGTATLFPAPRPESLPGWIVQRARKQGGTITPPAAQLLAQYVGAELHALDHEVAKLVTYAGARPVTPEDVQALVPAAGQANIFGMVDALGQRDTRRATQLLHQLLDVGEHPLGLLGMIVRQFRLLLLVKELADGGLRAHDIARRLGQAPFVVDKLVKQARHFTLPQLEQIYRRLLDVDLAIKNGETEADVALDLFVAGLA